MFENARSTIYQYRTNWIADLIINFLFKIFNREVADYGLSASKLLWQKQNKLKQTSANVLTNKVSHLTGFSASRKRKKKIENFSRIWNPGNLEKFFEISG